MEKQINWKYNKSVTENHSIVQRIPECLESIGNLTMREGAKSNIFKDEICIDADLVEKNIAKAQNRGQRNASVDLAFGLNNLVNKNIKLVLVELRLNYDSINNIGRKEIEDKINNTKTILAYNPPFYEINYFVFPENIAAQANHKIRRLFNNKNTNQALSLATLKLLFFE